MSEPQPVQADSTVDAAVDLDAIETDLDAIEAALAGVPEPPADLRPGGG